MTNALPYQTVNVVTQGAQTVTISGELTSTQTTIEGLTADQYVLVSGAQDPITVASSTEPPIVVVGVTGAASQIVVTSQPATQDIVTVFYGQQGPAGPVGPDGGKTRITIPSWPPAFILPNVIYTVIDSTTGSESQWETDSSGTASRRLDIQGIQSVVAQMLVNSAGKPLS